MENNPDNPFNDAIEEYLDLLRNLQFKRPYLPSVIYLIVLLFLILIMCIFYITIGVSTQICRLLWGAASNSLSKVHSADNLIESFSHGVAVGVFSLISVPFALIILPAYLVGALVSLFQDLLYWFL